MIVAIVNIFQYGLFDIRGIAIPFTPFTPHAFTVLTWCLLYIVLYYETRHIHYTIRYSVMVLVIMASVLISHDFAWWVERTFSGSTINAANAIHIMFIGSGGGLSHLVIGAIMVTIVIVLGKMYKFTDVSKWFWILGALFIVSLYFLTIDGYWVAWDMYASGLTQKAPQGWMWGVMEFSGQMMWAGLIGTKKGKEMK